MSRDPLLDPLVDLIAERALRNLQREGARNLRRMLAGGRAGGWYTCSKLASATQVRIYDDIGAGGVTAKSFLASLGDAGHVELRVNSGGGDFFEGLTLFNALRLRPGTVSVVVDGLAASAASIVCMAASPGRLGMAPGSRLMIHEVWSAGQGCSAELAAQAAVLDGLSDSVAEVYAGRSGRPAPYWRDLMKAETWFTAREAVRAGLADYVAGG